MKLLVSALEPSSNLHLKELLKHTHDVELLGIFDKSIKEGTALYDISEMANETLGDIVEKGTSMADEVKEKSADVYHNVKEKASDALNKVKKEADEVDLDFNMDDVFSEEEDLKKLKGNFAIGHNRYSTTGLSTGANIQPLLTRFRGHTLAVGHNGNITNSYGLKRKLEASGAIFQTTSDSEIIMHLAARSREKLMRRKIGTRTVNGHQTQSQQ